MTLWQLAACPEQDLIIAGNERGELLVLTEELRDQAVLEWQEPIRVPPTPKACTWYAPIMRHEYQPADMLEHEAIVINQVKIAGMKLNCGFGSQTKTWVVMERVV